MLRRPAQRGHAIGLVPKLSPSPVWAERTHAVDPQSFAQFPSYHAPSVRALLEARPSPSRPSLSLLSTPHRRYRTL